MLITNTNHHQRPQVRTAPSRQATAPGVRGDTFTPSPVELSKSIQAPAPESSSFWKTIAMVGMATAGLVAVTASPASAVTQSTGTAVVHNSQWGYSPVGRVEGNTIHDSQWGYDPIGRIDDDGTVHDSQWGYSPIGRVEEDGTVHDSQWGYSPIGRVEEDGTVHDSQWGYDPIGRVEGASDGQVELTERGGAALLLLLGD